MSYEFFIGLRYLRAKRKHTFVSVISFISILGITVGVTATGFEEDLKDKILGINAHIVVMESLGPMEDYEEVTNTVKGVDGVVGATPFIYSQAMLSSVGDVVGVVVRGLDLDTVGEVIVLPERISEGTLEGLRPTFGEAPPGVVIGSELARNLGAGVGDEINVISPMARAAGMGAVPRMASFNIAGIFSTGMYEYDSSLAFISIENAQKFFKLGDTVTGVEIKISDIYKAEEVGIRIERALGESYWARTWTEMNRNLFSALKLERVAMFIILMLIIIVAALNIISTLIMVVMEKGKDIAILKSMGATKAGIMKIFMIEGSVIGIVGTFLGTVLGLLAALNLEKVVGFFEWLFEFKVLPPSVYYIDRLPSKVEPTVVVLIVIISLGISFLATIYPSWRASRLDPVEGLRYE
jgi:lipoprotein-releasing system permease protein